MSKRSEAEFERIIQEFDSKMSGVQCSVSEYLDGLKSAQDRIEVAIEAAENDLKNRERE